MSKLVNYRLDDDLLEALKARAKDDTRTMTATVSLILRESLVKSGHLKEKGK